MVPNHSVTETLQTENSRLRQQVAALEQTVAELCQSRQMLQLVLDSLPLAVAWKNSELIYQGCNRQFAQSAGIESPADIVGKTDFDLREPALAEQQRAAEHQVMTRREPEDHHEVRQGQNGTSPTWLHTSRIPLDNGGETPCGVLEVSEDITRYQREIARLSMFENLVTNASDAIAIITPDQTFLYANPAFLTLYGYRDHTEASLIGMLAPEEHKRLPAILQEAQTNEVWSKLMVYRHQEGRTFYGQVSGFTVRDTNQQSQGIAAIIRDVSEQVEKEQKFRMFYALVENAPDGFGVASLDGFTVYANQAYRSILGLNDVTGATFAQYVAPEDHWLIPEIVQQVQTTGAWQGRLTYQRSDGYRIKAQLTGFIARDENEQPLAMVGVIRDLTEQIRAEEERAALQEQIIIAQQATLRELSTPLIPLANNIVAMPLIGSIDSNRAQQILEALLQGVADHRAATVIIDITGVQVVDTQVANALVRAAQAVKLLGAQVILTGIRPEIAQTLVGLGADLTGITTQNTLQSGITFALKQLPGKTNRGNQVKTRTPLPRNPNRA